MAQITGGSVTYSQTVKVTEYEPKKAEARLDFAVEEGGNAIPIFNTAGALAKSKVQELLGIAKPTAAAAAPETPAVETQKPAAKPPGKRGPKPAEKPAETPAISTGGERVAPDDDFGDVFDPNSTSSATGSQGAGAASEPDEWAEVEEDKPVEITDKELLSACARKNAEIKTAAPIRVLVAEFAGPIPKGTKDIPQAKRKDFLDKLKGLKA